jgi:hypothetical protein
MANKDIHHSFCMQTAMKYGVEIAVLIHHFQYWISFNRRKKSNKHFHDGRWWFYQTREDICAALPYMDFQKVRYLTDLMEEKGIILKGNFNRSKMDRTIWYAFVDEPEFLDLEESNNVYESGKPQSTAENRRPYAENRTPIPDPNSYPKTTDIKKDSYVPSAIASGLAASLLEAIKITKPDFKKPNLKKWAKEIDLMIRTENRLPANIQKVIDWLPTNWWKKNVMSADKLRLHFDRLELEMQDLRANGPGIQVLNKEMALRVIAKNPEQIKKNEILLTETGILFEYGAVHDLIEFQNPKYKEKLTYRLQKMGLDVSEL